jgi:hypothetical protein
LDWLNSRRLEAFCEKASDVIEDPAMILNALLDIAPSLLLTLARMCARKLARSARDQKEGLSIEAPADGDFRCPSLPSRGFGCLDREQ